MIAVIFEFNPDPAHSEQYFDLAAKLRDKVEKIDGFISIERFQSLADENKFVSISFWRDHEAVDTWYQVPDHRNAQEEGRQGEARTEEGLSDAQLVLVLQARTRHRRLGSLAERTLTWPSALGNLGHSAAEPQPRGARSSRERSRAPAPSTP